MLYTLRKFDQLYVLYIFFSYTIVFHLPEFHEFEVENSTNHRRYPRLDITISINGI